MSMTLQDMVNISTLTRNTAVGSSQSGVASASGLTSAITQALDSANKRTSGQISQTNVRLSSYGQIQSGFSALQSTGKALTILAANSSASDVGKAAQGFVDAFNSTNSAISSAVNGNGKTAGTLANDVAARLSGNDLRRFATSSTSRAELTAIGVSINQNGSLSLDSKALANALQANPDAVRSTLAKLGQQASSTASNELSSSGTVGKAVNSLNIQAKNLVAQQVQEQKLVASAQATLQQSANQFSGFGASSSGVDAYMKIFSL